MEFHTVNQNYGATELKDIYSKNLRKGLIFAVLIHVTIFSVYFFSIYLNEISAKEQYSRKPFVFVDPIEQPPPINEKEIPPVKDIIKPEKDLSAMEPQPVPKELKEIITLKTQDELNKIDNNASKTGDSVKYSDKEHKTFDDKKIDDKIKKDKEPPKIYNSYEVEVLPVCINLTNVKNSMPFPDLAREIGQEGNVTVKVLVGEDGNVIKTGALTGPEIFYDEVKSKAKDLVFSPGLQNNTPVKVWVTVPFNFKLK